MGSNYEIYTKNEDVLKMAGNDRFAAIAENNPLVGIQVEEVPPMNLPEGKGFREFEKPKEGVR